MRVDLTWDDDFESDQLPSLQDMLDTNSPSSTSKDNALASTSGVQTPQQAGEDKDIYLIR